MRGYWAKPRRSRRFHYFETAPATESACGKFTRGLPVVEQKPLETAQRGRFPVESCWRCARWFQEATTPWIPEPHR